MATTQAEQRTMEEGKNYQTADRICCAVLVLCYLALGIFSRLYTIYPVDDDWSYIRAAQTFFQTGQLKFTPWTSPSLVFQILWGTLFCLLSGSPPIPLLFQRLP